MKKFIRTILCIALTAFLFASCSAPKNTSSSAPAAEAAEEKPAAEESLEQSEEIPPEDVPAPVPEEPHEEAEQTEAADDENAGAEAGGEKTGPSPYSRLWLFRYANASTVSLEEQVGDNGVYDEITEFPPKETYKLIVDYHNQAVWVLTKGEEEEYTELERVMICSTGGNGNWTPEGNYLMDEHRVRFGEFKSDGSYGQYWTQIFARFYFHSLLYTQRSAGTWTQSSYNNLGTPVSHGCVRLFVPDARWIYYNIAPGTQCIITTEIEKNDYLKYALRHGYDGATDVLAEEEEYPVIYTRQAEAAHEKTWEQVLEAAKTPVPEKSVQY